MAAFAAPVRADIIDRLMAVVGGRPIMLSDVNAAMAFGIVPEPRQPGRLMGPLNALISRDLMLIEVDRYQPPEPAADAVEAKAAAYERTVGTPADVDRLLAAVGWTREMLRRVARDDLRIQVYLDQRFAAAAQPTEAEIAAYYREHQAEFTRNGAVQPLTAVADTIRAQLTSDRRSQLIRDWVAGLRQRVDVAVTYQVNSQIPNSQRPTPNSQFPIPNSQFPIPNSQIEQLINLGVGSCGVGNLGVGN